MKEFVRIDHEWGLNISNFTSRKVQSFLHMKSRQFLVSDVSKRALANSGGGVAVLVAC